jgi:hypothetical protein
MPSLKWPWWESQSPSYARSSFKKRSGWLPRRIPHAPLRTKPKTSKNTGTN